MTACVHCGQSVGRYGAVQDDMGTVFCPPLPGEPDCARLVVEFRHPTPCPWCRGVFPVAGSPDAARGRGLRD